MSVINQYLNDTSADEKKPTEAQPSTSASSAVINQYLSMPSETSKATPAKGEKLAPNEHGFSINDETKYETGPHNTRGIDPIIEGVKNLPGALWNSLKKNASESLSTMGQGASEVMSNKPASGVGNIGMGALGLATSLPSAALSELVAKPVANITGNKSIGDRAADIAGIGIPVRALTKTIKANLPSNVAFKKLVEDIGPDNAGKVAAAMEANPRLTPADLSDQVMHGVQKLYANVEGPHVDYLGKATEARKASAASHIENEMNANLGKVVDPVAKVAELQNKIKEVGKKDIEPALAMISQPVDLTSSVAYIDKKLTPDLHSILNSKEAPLTDDAKKELQKFRDLFVEEQVGKDGTKIQAVRSIDAQSANVLQSVIRSTGERLIEKGGQDARIGHALMGLRSHIVDTLDAASKAGSPVTVPKQFTEAAKNLKTPSGKVDETGLWFVNGDKPVYAQATEAGAKNFLGDEANKLAQYGKITGKDANGNPITVWYKPGEEARAQAAVDNFTSNLKTSNKVEDKIAYHKKNGELYGYSENSVNNYIRKRFGDDAADAAGIGKVGSYKEALGKYRDEYHVSDAFEKGHDSIMANGRKLESRPEFFEKWVKDATPTELEAAREGARIAYDTQMNAFRHAARRGTDIGDVDFNMRRMKALFGEEEASRMAKVFNDEKIIADRNNKLTQNSQTQMRNVQGSYFEPYERKSGGSTFTDLAVPELVTTAMGMPGVGAAVATTAKAANAGGGKIAGKVIRALENNRNMQYAKYALPVEGPDRDKLIQDLKAVASAQGVKPKRLQRAATSLTRLIAP